MATNHAEQKARVTGTWDPLRQVTLCDGCGVIIDAYPASMANDGDDWQDHECQRRP